MSIHSKSEPQQIALPAAEAEIAADAGLPPGEAAIARLGSFLFPPLPDGQDLEFLKQYNERSAVVARLGLILGECLFVAFYFWDRVVDLENSSTTLKIRLLVATWFVAVTLCPPRIFRRNLQTLMTPSIIAAGIGVVVIISIEHDGLNVGVGGVVLVLMFNFGFFRLLFGPSMISGLIIVTAYNVAAVLKGLDVLHTVANNFFLVSALVSGSTVTYLFERLFREQFVMDRELSNERNNLARQHKNDSQHIGWLRQLAEFLRHEVRQPIARVNSSVEIASLASGENSPVRPHLASAALDVQHVWNLVERASQATDAEAFVRQGRPEQIDLSRLLGECLDAYRQTHSGTVFGFRAVDGVRADADAMLIKEAVDNLIGNAVSFAEAGSAVELSLDVTRQAATIAVRNRGPAIEGDLERLFGPFASTRSGPMSEHQGLGLYLVRLIAEHHGGTAAIANLADGSGVQATIMLPLGVRLR